MLTHAGLYKCSLPLTTAASSGDSGLYKGSLPHQTTVSRGDLVVDQNNQSYYFLQSVHFKLQNNQTLVVAGCFSGSGEDTGWTISGDDLPYPDPKFKIDAEEADMHENLAACY